MSDSSASKAFNVCYNLLLLRLQQGLKDICDQLRSREMLSPQVLDYVSNDHHDSGDKARQVLDAVSNQIKTNPQAIYVFTDALEASGGWTKSVTDQLKTSIATFEERSNQQIKPVFSNSLLCEVGIIVMLGIFITYIFRDANILTEVDMSNSSQDTSLECYEAFPQHCLPNINSLFFGRAKELEELKELVLTNSVRVININGPPAFGKSRLAIQLGYELRNHSNAIRSIRYINTMTTKKSFFLCSPYLRQKQAKAKMSNTDEIATARSQTKSDQNLYNDNLCTWISRLEQRAVLIFDNCDPILHSEDRKKFLDILQEYLSLNVQLYNIVVVSQEQLLFLEDGFLPIHLGALSAEDSQRMLMHYVKNLTTEKAANISMVVGGCPLALKVVAKLLTQGRRGDLNNFDSLLSKLKENITRTLSHKISREEDQLYKVIDIAYKHYLDTKSRKCSRILGLFPGLVNEEMAKNVLSSIIDPFCIEDVINFSFLEESSIEQTRMFTIHTVVQDYLKSIHIVDSDVKTFNSSFLKYYSNFLKKVMKQIYIDENLSDENSFKLNEIEYHNVIAFVPMFLSTEIDKEVVLHSALAIGFLIYDNKILDLYVEDVFLKTYEMYSDSSIFDSVCAYSSEKICTTIFWKSFSFIGVQNECDTLSAYITNPFVNHSVCSHLYSCTNLNYQYLPLHKNINWSGQYVGVVVKCYCCRLKAFLRWLFSEYKILLILVSVYIVVTILVATVMPYVAGLLFIILFVLLLFYGLFWLLDIEYNIYFWFQLYYSLLYVPCIFLSGSVERLQCTSFPTSFSNNTMSLTCKTSTTIVEEHAFHITMFFLLLFFFLLSLLITTLDTFFTELVQSLFNKMMWITFLYSIFVFATACSILSTVLVKSTYAAILFYTMHLLVYIFYSSFHFSNLARPGIGCFIAMAFYYILCYTILLICIILFFFYIYLFGTYLFFRFKNCFNDAMAGSPQFSIFLLH